MLPVEQPFKTYTGLDGKPLDNGYVYFGQPNQNPVTAPITVFWDAAGAIPAAQPLRTVNGYIMRGGTPANVFVDGAYSELVKDSKGRQVFYARTSDEFSVAAFILGLAKSAGSSLVGFLQAGVGAVLRTAESKLRETVSVKDFGAKGDGAANDTAAITKADFYAASIGADLLFPAGTYMVDPLTATTSWRGERGTMIKYRGAANVDLVTATGVDYIQFRDIVFDGSVSADPGAWSAANYDSFTGATGLIISNCAGARVEHCRGQNMRNHSFKFVGCTNSSWDDCESKRNRGNFGDAFISISGVGISANHCRAYDFTRIGFVWDTFGATPLTSYHLALRGCIAENGHDASVLYGGGEYNAGAWFENCAHVTVDGFTVRNMTSSVGRGLLMASGAQNNGVPGTIATFTATNLRFENTGAGVVAYSLGTFPVAVHVENIQAYGVYHGLFLQPKLEQDSFTCDDGYIDLDYSLNPANTLAVLVYPSAGLASKPLVTVNDMVIKHTNENLAMLTGYNTTSSSTDIGAPASNTNTNGVQLAIRNVRNIAGTPVWIGIPFNNASDLKISDTYVRIPYASFLNTGSAVLERVRIHSGALGDGSAARVELYDCTIEGLLRLGGAFVKVAGGSVRIADAGYLWLFSTATGKRPGIVMTDVYVEKDIAANGYPVRFGFGGSSFSAVVSDSQFYNSGAASTGACIAYGFGANVIFNGVLKDSTVASMSAFEDGTGGVALPLGVTAATFH